MHPIRPTHPARRRHRSLGGHAVALALGLGLGALLVACAPSEPEARPASSSTTAPPIPPAAVDLECTGSGSRTVLLISGFGDAGDSWAAVAPELAEDARVCTAPRFGLGRSDAPPADQTFASAAEALHLALDGAGEAGPYVLVGHSFGGAEAVAFADRYRSEVAGLVLVDASPTTWPEAACAVDDDGSEAAASFVAACASFAPDRNAERLDVARAFGEVAEIASLGDLPMTVITRADPRPAGLAAGPAATLAEAWRAGQQHWASLSSASRVEPVAGTGHLIQLDRPDVVVAQVRSMG